MWQHAWRLAILTFNYDTLSEAGYESAIQRRFQSIEDYMLGNRLLLKPHGSCDWVRPVRSILSFGDDAASGPSGARRELYGIAGSWAPLKQ